MSIAVFTSKSSRDRRRDITRAAAGEDIVIQRMTPGKSVVNWGEAPDHVHSPGPNAANYEKMFLYGIEVNIVLEVGFLFSVVLQALK
jgi:hypothetical protein